MDLKQGQLLIASRKLVDPNFSRSAVLLVQYREEGALGLVLNRPLETTVAEAWRQVSEEPCSCERLLHQGGPCEGPLMVVHDDESLSEVEVVPGVHFTTNREAIEDLVNRPEAKSKFFVGYAGWGAGQLESEIESGSWLTTRATIEQVFTQDDVWETLSKSLTRAAAFPWLDPKLIPDDPSVN